MVVLGGCSGDYMLKLFIINWQHRVNTDAKDCGAGGARRDVS